MNPLIQINPISQNEDYSVITKKFINSIIIETKEQIKKDLNYFKHPICWFLKKEHNKEKPFKISNAIILDYPPQVKFKFLSILKKEFKQQNAIAYVILKKTTIQEKILKTPEVSIPKTINNNYTLNIKPLNKYKTLTKTCLILKFASQLEKIKITIPYTLNILNNNTQNITLEDFKEEVLKGELNFNLLS